MSASDAMVWIVVCAVFVAPQTRLSESEVTSRPIDHDADQPMSVEKWEVNSEVWC